MTIPMTIFVLNGVWKPVAHQEHGRQRASEQVRPMAELVIIGNQFTVRSGDHVYAAGVIRLDLSAFPHRVDFVQVHGGQTVGEPQRGIFQADGDRLTTCLAGSGKPRPTAFETGPGIDQGLTVYQRVLD